MKKILLPCIVSLLLCSCGSSSQNSSEVDIEEKITESVTNVLRSKMKNPDSFKIESIEIQKDTLPYYFNADILSKAEDAYEAFETYSRYSERSSYLWWEEQMTSAAEFSEKKSELEAAIQDAKINNFEDPLIEYIACIRASGENSFGGTNSSKYICVVDKSDVSKVMCTYHVDEEFINAYFMIIIAETDGNIEFEKDRFGNYDTSKLPFVDGFLLGD